MDYRTRWELKDYLVGRRLETRILLFHLALGLLLVGFLLNFWYLQVTIGERYDRLAEGNRLRRIRMAPTRGLVFDRREEVIAATRPSLNLVLLREGATNVEAQLARLAPILGTPPEELAQRLAQMRQRPLYEPLLLKEDVGLAELAPIEARREQFPSIEVQQTERRSYPLGGLFSHVLGYVGEASEAQVAREAGAIDAGEIVGKTGIEKTYDDLLRGDRGWNVVSVNNLGRRMGGAWIDREPRHGESVGLTLDVRLQRALQEALGQEAGAGVFLDPWTGDVLALASSPSFDPNLFADGITREDWGRITDDPRRPLHDRAIASFYAPGSTFKVLMAIAGLESGALTPGETMFCSGSTTIYGRRRLCWKRGGHGTVSLHRALSESCNVYFYNVGKRLGIDPIHEFGDRFNLGRTTGIDLPGEAPGILPTREWKQAQMGEPWYPGDTISIAIGQGLLAVTPIQLATMISAVATEGSLPHPHLSRGETREPAQVHVRPETFRIVKAALRDAVRLGTGRRADLEGVSVAGKTGTAQVFVHSAGIDADLLPKHERDHAWFVGYAPADQPRIAFAVVVEHGGHGGTSAAPIVRSVLEVFFADSPPAPARPVTSDQAGGATTGEGNVRTSTAG